MFFSKETGVFAAACMMVFTVVFDAGRLLSRQEFAANDCYRTITGLCDDNVNAITCEGATVCVDILDPYSSLPVLACEYGEEVDTPSLPEKPEGTVIIGDLGPVEIENRSLNTAADTNDGLDTKMLGATLPCQVVYRCKCEEQNEPCERDDASAYDSRATINTSYADGEPCVVEE